MEETLLAMQSSMQWLEESHDKLLYDIAVSVETRARQRALDRLFKLSHEGRTYLDRSSICPLRLRIPVEAV